MGQRAAAASSRKGSAKINKAPTGGAKIAGIGDETSEPSKSDDKDDAELELASMVADGNEDGIEHLLSELRGIPGRAALRKNAKKALKRIREERSLLSVGAAPASGEWMETSSKSSRAAKSAGSSNIMASGVGMGGSTVVSLPAPTKEVVAQKNAVSTTSTASSPTLKEESKASIQPTIYGGGSATSTAQAAVTTPSSLYKPPEPLLKFVSHTHRAPGQAPLNEDRGTYHAPASARTECVLHMAPSVVGWVIGRGGQRIRDLMEESTAKVWIDQDSMGPKEMRIVYVSGSRKAVDVAVRMIKDLVAKAPVGGGGVGQVLPAASAPVTAMTSLSSNVPTAVVGASAFFSGTANALSGPSNRSSASAAVSLVPNPAQQMAMAEQAIVTSATGSRRAISVSSGAPASFANAVSGASATLPVAVLPSFAAAAAAPSSLATSASSSARTSLSSPILLMPPGVPSAPMTAASMPVSSLPSDISETRPPALHSTAKSPSDFPSTADQQKQRRPEAVHELTCEPRFVPLLIGRRGWTVKHIQDASGARVDIDQTVTPRRIIISGASDQVKNAVRMVRDVLSYPHAQIHQHAPGVGDEEAAIHDIMADFVGGDLSHITPYSADSDGLFMDIREPVSAGTMPEYIPISIGQNGPTPASAPGDMFEQQGAGFQVQHVGGLPPNHLPVSFMVTQQQYQNTLLSGPPPQSLSFSAGATMGGDGLGWPQQDPYQTQQQVMTSHSKTPPQELMRRGVSHQYSAGVMTGAPIHHQSSRHQMPPPGIEGAPPQHSYQGFMVQQGVQGHGMQHQQQQEQQMQQLPSAPSQFVSSGGPVDGNILFGTAASSADSSSQVAELSLGAMGDSSILDRGTSFGSALGSNHPLSGIPSSSDTAGAAAHSTPVRSLSLPPGLDSLPPVPSTSTTQSSSAFSAFHTSHEEAFKSAAVVSAGAGTAAERDIIDDLFGGSSAEGVVVSSSRNAVSDDETKVPGVSSLLGGFRSMSLGNNDGNDSWGSSIPRWGGGLVANGSSSGDATAGGGRSAAQRQGIGLGGVVLSQDP